jgi:ribonuclease-3
MAQLSDLESRLGYHFLDSTRLVVALTHSSAVDGPQPRVAERLEFLGDAVVGLVLSDLLLERFPVHNEGQLSKYRAALVNTFSFASKARELGLNDFLMLGKGEEKTGGREKPSILAAVYEAVMGAIFLEGGYLTVRGIVATHFGNALEDVDRWQQTDPKTELQELCQERYRSAPVYRVVRETGPFHARRFAVDVVLDGSILASGEGTSKRLAEQDAARQALHLSAAMLFAPVNESP